MNDIIKSIEILFSSEKILFAIVDADAGNLRMLVQSVDKSQAEKILKSNGWKSVRDHSRDIFLYGMDHFSYYEKKGVNLTISCQLACRSTLNGEWVPLDRKINNNVLLNANKGESYLVDLQEEDLLCYLLAKCVYTKKIFSDQDKLRIDECIQRVNLEKLMPKLEGVFFRFSKPMLDLIRKDDYDHIIGSLWSFAEY